MFFRTFFHNKEQNQTSPKSGLLSSLTLSVAYEEKMGQFLEHTSWKMGWKETILNQKDMKGRNAPLTTIQPAAWSHIFSRYPLLGKRKYIAPSPLDRAPYFAWLSILTGGALTPSFCSWSDNVNEMCAD